MTVEATYTLYIDWNDDGDFGDAGEDITDDLIDVTVTRGFGDSLKRVAQTGQLSITLDNIDKTYSPANTANMRPYRPIKLDMTYDGDTVTLFTGYIDTIRPVPGRFSKRTATITARDAMYLLERAQGNIALQTDCTADELIEATVAAVYTPDTTDYDAGINRFATSAPNWVYDAGNLTEEVNATMKLTEICASDWGRFFIAADGTPTYRNRHYIPLNDSVVLALDNDMLSMAYQMSASDIFNQVDVTVYPRTVAESYEILGRLSQQSAPRIEAGATLTLTVYFSDPANSSITVGGSDIITPVSGTDYDTTKDEAGQGDSTNATVTVSDIDKYSDRAVVTLSNSAAYPVYVQRLQVRGHAVRARSQVTVTKTEAVDGNAFSLRASLIDDVTEGGLLAQHLLNRRSSAVNDVRNVQITARESAARMEMVRDSELLQRVTITEDQTALSSMAGYIYWMQHKITRSQHMLTFHVGQQYQYSGDPFTIGTSTLGGTDVLIY